MGMLARTISLLPVGTLASYMKIVIHQDYDERGNVLVEHVIFTDVAPWNQVTDPAAGGAKVDMAAFLLQCQADPVKRAAAGYNRSAQLIGELAPRTCWQRLVDASRHPLADPAIAGKLS